MIEKKKSFGTRIKTVFGFLKEVFSNFSNDKVMKFSASLSYYTVFSIAPILVIIISIVTFFVGKDADINGQIFGQIQGLVGVEAGKQIEDMIAKTHRSGNTFMASIISVIVLILGATGIFGEIQDSINSIWGLKAKPKRGFIKIIINRLISFSLIISLGFLAMVTLLLNTAVDVLSKNLGNLIPAAGQIFVEVLNYILIFVAITVMFTVIFKVLPDAKIKWRDVFKGAILTAILFIIGKSVISIYVQKSNLSSVYGAAGSIVILLVWVYYTAVILYFGAEFTKVYAIKYGSKILPNDYAVFVQVEEHEETGKALHEVHNDEKVSTNVS